MSSRPSRKENAAGSYLTRARIAPQIAKALSTYPPAMNIVDVTQVLLAHSLRAQPLGALEPARTPYRALLCQPHGAIHGSTDRVGNADSAAAVPMYRAFLDDAVRHQAQLVVTPEYSVPWRVVDDIIAGQVRPPVGALWALGLESITPNDLEALAATLGAEADVRLIHEPFDQTMRAQRNFIDPLGYVFWCADAADRNVLCLLIQFKTVVSRDLSELNALYTGSQVYKFSTGINGIALIGLICSDVFEFDDALVNAHHPNLLLLHVQLNRKPGHVDYAAYRQRLFSVASNSHVEILCLNWAAHLLVEGNGAAPWNAVSGSAWYVSPSGVEVKDGDVDALHKSGVYYSLVGERWHGFYFNYSAHSILLQKQHVVATGAQALVQRIAPQVVERRTWDQATSMWDVTPADDGFAAFLQPYAPLGVALQPMVENENPLCVERALELLDGPSGRPQTWFTLSELKAFHVADEESLRRVTVSQEVDPVRAGVAFRRERAGRAQSAVTIQAAAPKWPAAVADLAGGFRFRWTPMDPHRNVEPTSGTAGPATLVYLGENPQGDVLANVHSKMVKALQVHAATRGAGGIGPDAVDRLCVAYKRNHTLLFFRDSQRVSISDPRGAAIDDITGESP